MLKLHNNFKIILIGLLVFSFTALLPGKTTYSFSDQVLVVGVRGDDVYELQGRLSFLGYYHHAIDGQFGWQTYHAVKNFQYQFGLKVDGIVGPKSKLKLWEATKNWRPSGQGAADNTAGGGGNTAAQAPAGMSSLKQYSQNDLNMLARAVYSEARGEPYKGQVAVAAVILNRLQSPLFPDTVSGVILQPRAFTAVDDGQFWGLSPDETAYRAVNDAINGWDPTYKALYYFNPVTATSGWIWSREQIVTIGKHIFCR